MRHAFRSGAPSVRRPAGVCAGHRAGPRPRHRRRRRRLHRRRRACCSGRCRIADPDRLVTFWDTNAQKGLSHEPLSPVNFMDYRKLQAFEDAAAWWRPDVNLVDPGVDPVRVRTIETGANLFAVLGVSPQVGPGFPADGPMFDRNLICVISDRLWRARYSADAGIDRPADPAQRPSVHRRRRHAAAVRLPRRHRRLAAIAAGTSRSTRATRTSWKPWPVSNRAWRCATQSPKLTTLAQKLETDFVRPRTAAGASALVPLSTTSSATTGRR